MHNRVKAGKAVEVNCQNMIYTRNVGLVRLALIRRSRAWANGRKMPACIAA